MNPLDAKLATVTLTAGERAVAGLEGKLLHTTCTRRVNKIPYAQLLLLDGDPAKQDFPLSGRREFNLNMPLEVSLRFEGEGPGTTLFSGVVVRQNIRTTDEGTVLILELEEPANALDADRQSAVHPAGESDGELIEGLLKKSGLKAGTVGDTPRRDAPLVQYDCSDWDFLVMRSEANGLLVLAEGERISAFKPDPTKSPAFIYNHGITPASAFDLATGGRDDAKQLIATGWDPATQQARSTSRAGASRSPLARAEVGLHTGESLSEAELAAWTQARKLKSDLAFLRGTLTVEGDPTLKPGQTIELRGVGERFGKRALITGVSHEAGANRWETVIQFGLDPRWHRERHDDVDSPPAAGLVAGVPGVQVGVVREVTKEKESNTHRATVWIPAMGDKKKGPLLTARLLTPYGGKEQGMLFLPSAEDEVLVGFVNGDPRDAVVLGGMYSKARPAPPEFGTDEQGNRQGIVTTKKFQLAFDDPRESLRIVTPKGRSVTLDDHNETLTITDAHGNRLLLGKEGVTLDSGKRLTLKAGEDIAVEAGGNLKLVGKRIDLN